MAYIYRYRCSRCKLEFDVRLQKGEEKFNVLLPAICPSCGKRSGKPLNEGEELELVNNKQPSPRL